MFGFKVDCCHVALALVTITIPIVATLSNKVNKLKKKNDQEQEQINGLKEQIDMFKKLFFQNSHSSQKYSWKRKDRKNNND